MVHLVHPIDGWSEQGVQEHCHGSHILASPGEGRARWPFTVDGNGDGLGLSSGLSEVDVCGPLRLERDLVAV
jgi:hypothetical protein